MYVRPFSLLTSVLGIGLGAVYWELTIDNVGVDRVRFYSSSRRILKISRNLRNGRGLLRGLRRGVGISIRLLLCRRSLRS